MPTPAEPALKNVYEGQACANIFLAHAQHALTVTQTTAVTTEISNSKDDSNNMTTHNSRNASNSKQQTATAKACAAPGAVYTTETSVASECVYTTKACAAHRRVYTTKARAEPRRVYIMVSCAAPEGVYTMRPVFLLEMSTLQGPELHLDVLWGLRVLF